MLGFAIFLANPVILLVGIGLTIFGSLLPDIVEPANDPRHRSNFHSIQLGLILVLCLLILLNELTPLTLLVVYIIAGYLSHLFLDATTPRGLPSWKIT